MRKFATILLPVLCLCAGTVTWISQRPVQSVTQTPTKQGCKASEKMVCLYVVVTDIFGTPVGSLKQHNFDVRAGKRRTSIAFFSDEPMPASIAVLFDVSRPTSIEALRLAAQSLYLLRQAGLTANEYLIATFSEKENLLVKWTNEEQLISSALRKVGATKPKGDSALFDALYVNIERLRSASNQRRVLVLFSDGFNGASRHRGFKEVRELLEHSNITLYVIGNGLSNSGSAYVRHAHDQMNELATDSGGDAYFPAVEEIPHAFGRVATHLRYQYTLGIESDPRSGKWHSLKILVEHPDLKAREADVIIRAPRGYYD